MCKVVDGRKAGERISGPGSPAPDWLEVEPDALGAGPRQLCHTLGGLVWSYDRHLCGAVCTSASVAGIQRMARAFAAVYRNARPPLDLVSDMRGFATGPDAASGLAFIYDSLPAFKASLGGTLARQAGILAPDWTAPYYPALARTFELPWTVTMCRDMPEVWSFLETDADVAADIDAMLERETGRPPALVALAAALKAAPHLTLAAAAKSIGVAGRTLQRALAERGESFAELRDRARIERARALLVAGVKVEAVAKAVGLSRSHFSAWFRRHEGVLPSAFRDDEGA